MTHKSPNPKYRVLVVRALWVIIMLLIDIIRMHEHDDLVKIGLVIAKRYQDDLLAYDASHQ